jgi:hypothetical protein
MGQEQVLSTPSTSKSRQRKENKIEEEITIDTPTKEVAVSHVINVGNTTVASVTSSRKKKHPDVNRHGKWNDSETFEKLQTISETLTSLQYGKRLQNNGERGWSLVETTRGPERMRKIVSPKQNIIELRNSMVNEIIDLNVVVSDYKTRSSDREEKEKPYAEGEKSKFTILLDSGCIGRDFINKNVVEKLYLKKQRILHPIKINSIHSSHYRLIIFLKYGVLSLKEILISSNLIIGTSLWLTTKENPS